MIHHPKSRANSRKAALLFDGLQDATWMSHASDSSPLNAFLEMPVVEPLIFCMQNILAPILMSAAPILKMFPKLFFFHIQCICIDGMSSQHYNKLLLFPRYVLISFSMQLVE